MEIETTGGRYHLSPFDAFYIGDEKPRIVFSRAGKKTPLDLPVAAGRIRSLEVIPAGIRVVVFAQSALGRRKEGGRELLGVSHKGTCRGIHRQQD